MGVKEASAAYRLAHEAVQAEGGMPEGYKRTEAGVIPEDWRALRFNRLFQRVNGKNHQVLASDYQADGQLQIVDQGQELIAGWTDRLEKRFPCPDGGVLVFGDHTRVVKYVSSDFAVGADGTQLLVGKDSESTRFLAYQLQASEIPSAGYNRHFKFLLESTFAVPESLIELQAITEALSDADALIESLQQLIAKQRALKQGAMQVLLTGRQRLPGFADKWAKMAFADVVRHHAGNSTLIKGKLPSSHASGLYAGFSASGQDVWCDHYEYEGNAFVVSAVGSRCGKAFRASGKWCAIANTHIVWSDNSRVDERYLGLFINDENFWIKSGSGQPFVLFKQSLSRPVLLPSIPEQTAIATALSDMDAEIEALEARLAKTRALKAGMMQALLTGRIRLPLDQAA